MSRPLITTSRRSAEVPAKLTDSGHSGRSGWRAHRESEVTCGPRPRSLSYVTSAHGTEHGPYNASPYGGANFTFSTGSSSRTTVAISLTNSENTATLCAADYSV